MAKTTHIRTITSLLFIPLMLTATFNLVNGYSEGAPEEVCETLIPGHLKPPQNNTSCPYRIELSTYHMSSNHIKYNPIGGNQMMNITLTGLRAFKGFILQARMNDRIVGRFEPTPKHYRMLDCPEGVENTVTHIENDVKSEVTFKWVPPTRVAGKVWFYASVVRNFDVYWIDITSDPLELTMPAA